MTEGTQVRVIGTDRVGTVVKLSVRDNILVHRTQAMISVNDHGMTRLYWYDERELEVIG